MATVVEVKLASSKRQARIIDLLGRETIPELVEYAFHTMGYATTGHPASAHLYSASINVATNKDGLPELYVFVGDDTYLFEHNTYGGGMQYHHIPSHRLNKGIRNLRRGSVKIVHSEQNKEEDKIREEDFRKEI